MSDIVPNASSTSPDLIGRHAARLDACWPGVHVESVRVTPTLAGQLAHAVVQLGGLTPADIRVELIPTSSVEATAPAVHESRRMCSSQALGNGCFVFEATLPHRDAAPTQEWLIHVHPTEGLEEPRVEYRFRSDV